MTNQPTYPNLFTQLGYEEKVVNQRLETIWHTLFFGSEEERIYHEVDDMGYVVDTGNNDVRTEGMSYAMMVSVQLNQQEVFDRIWHWVKKYMWIQTGDNQDYFAWSILPDGTPNSSGPAPDGEEFFAMALFFASHRFGDREGIFNYSEQARKILSACIHKGEPNQPGEPMWDRDNYLIKFVPGVDFSDPSYHLPHFYDYFAKWADETDRKFWTQAAQASRDYLVKASHPETGLTAEYAEYDGTPKNVDHHDRFFSDAYRVAANIGLANVWAKNSEALNDCVRRLQRYFFETDPKAFTQVREIDGTKVNQEVRHPVGLIATVAQGSLAIDPLDENAILAVKKFWETPMRTGSRRYYDNFLYLFAFLALSGNYRIW